MELLLSLLANRCAKASSRSLDSPVKQKVGQEPDGRLNVDLAVADLAPPA